MKGLLRSAAESANEKAGERLHSTPSQVMGMLMKASGSSVRMVIQRRGAVSNEVRNKIFDGETEYTFNELKEVIDALVEFNHDLYRALSLGKTS